MENRFSDLGITPLILKALEEMGYEMPTEVQARAIPHILNKEDLIVMSKTGSGKTAVFGVSMLQMTDPAAPGPQGLILTPTRELAVQIDNDLKLISKHLQHKTTAVFGQHNMNTEIQAINRGVTIITGTPGRVYDHISNGHLETKHIRFLVLDEADRMLDMGFLDQVARIIRTLPRDRVTLLFSATIPPEIHRICSDYMKQPQTIEIESPTMTVDTIEQVYYRVERNEKRTQLNRLLMFEQPESCLIFCNTRIAVDQVQNALSKKGYAVQALHGDIPQAKRLKTIQQFKNGDFHLLVATDVAARGIHVDDLALVINYDVPNEKDNYVHRIGRTGRAGKIGRAITLVTGDDIISLYEIEEHIGAMIKEKEWPSEEEISASMATVGKWIQENTQKGRQDRPVSEEGRDGAQRKRSGARPNRSKTGQGRPAQPGTAQDKSYQSKTSQTKPAQRKPNGEEASQAKSAQSRPYQKRPSQPGSSTDRTPTGESAGARPPRNYDRNRSVPAGSTTEQKTTQRTTQSTTQSTTPRTGNSNPAGRTPYRTNTRTTTGRPTTAAPAPINRTEPIQKQESAVKQPFLKRLIQRILGK